MDNRILERKLERLEQLVEYWGEERVNRLPAYRHLMKTRNELLNEPKNSKKYRRWQKRRRKNRKKKARMK